MTDSIEAAVTALPPGDVPATPAPEAGTATLGESQPAATANQATTATTESAGAGSASEPSEGEHGNPNAAPTADAGAHEAGDAPVAGGDVPNAVPAAVEPTTALGSATSAAGVDTTSPIDASSPADALPLRAQVAQHLEAIYRAVANADKPVIDEAYGLKQHIGDVLQSIHNGIDVRSGEMVQKLEALFHKL